MTDFSKLGECAVARFRTTSSRSAISTTYDAWHQPEPMNPPLTRSDSDSTNLKDFVEAAAVFLKSDYDQ